MAVSVVAALALGLGFSLLTVTSAPATTGTAPYHLVISVASPRVVGTPFNFTVTLYDSNNVPVTDCGSLPNMHSGDIITFGSNSSHATFTAPTGTLNASCQTTGSVSFNASGAGFTITATDSTDGAVGAGDSGFFSVPNTATHFLVSAPASVTKGVPFSFTVQALDSGGNQATYSGTISFSSTDPLASLPGPTLIDSGVVTFTATLNTLGTQTITVTDGVISGSDSMTVVAAALDNAVRFVVTAPASVTSNALLAFTVTAVRADGSVATGYSGVVHFTSSDPLAKFSGNITLINGTGVALADLVTLGTQSIVATDTVTGITGSTTVVVVQRPIGTPLVQPRAPVPVTARPSFTG